ncbi:hypothetical protein BGZ63DRAFT_387923 [Mariannaea sp. PMI_226]|nr:hypothetical protein BGZ63DRAFT_387923 [Mariannaea sp. PMI_226]
MSSSIDSSADPPTILDIIPFITLPLLTILSFACPGFRGRGIFFSTLFILNDYACIISPWPPKEGPSRPMRYVMAGSWLFLLPAVERLLLHKPEEDFWCLDEEKKPKHACSRDWTLQKLGWAFALVSSPRAVGWNFGSRRVNAAREAIRKARPTKGVFLRSKVLRLVVAYLAIDTSITLANNTTIPDRWKWDWAVLPRIVFLEACMALSVYSIMTMQFELGAALSVGIGLSKPEDWPPLFGSIAECYTISNVWGKFWHGYIRQPVLGFSHAIIHALGIPKHSILAYGIHLLTAFLISAFFHILSLAVVCEGYLPISTLVSDMVCFFTAQAAGTTVEAAVIAQYGRYAEIIKKTHPKPLLHHFMESQRACRVLGYFWVASWFSITGWWFVRNYIAIGIMEWPLPFSFWEQTGLDRVLH